MLKNVLKNARKCAILLLFCLAATANAASDSFIVKRIHIEGLSSLESATVMHYVDVKKGQRFGRSDARAVLRRLYASGFFNSVRLARQGDVLIVSVEERRVISDIQIIGNKKLANKAIKPILEKVGLVKGEAYSEALMHRFKQAILAEYKSRSLRGAGIEVKTFNQSHHRLRVEIWVHEGHLSKIEGFQIIGNRAFSRARLLWIMGLSRRHWWTFMTHSDRYTSEEMDVALGHLRQFYLNRGYLDFHAEKPAVIFKKGGRSVYITIVIREGLPYRIGKIHLTGDWKGYRNNALGLIHFKVGDLAVQNKLLATQQELSKLLARGGYAVSRIF